MVAGIIDGPRQTRMSRTPVQAARKQDDRQRYAPDLVSRIEGAELETSRAVATDEYGDPDKQENRRGPLTQ
jgi:hypothetical protein